MGSHNRIELLGGIRLYIYGNQLSERLPTRKAETLLAYLYLTRKAASRDTLCAILWPDAETTKARNRLKQTLALIRKTLGEQAEIFLPTLSDRSQLRAAPNVTCDAVEVEIAVKEASKANSIDAANVHYKSVVALYSGPLLPTSNEDWIVQEQHRFQMHFFSARLRLARYHENLGEWEQALNYVFALYHDEPLDEEVVSDLIRLLTVSNRVAEALRIYRQFDARLRKEWNIEPSVELQNQVSLLRSGEQKGSLLREVGSVVASESAPSQDALRLLFQLRQNGIIQTTAENMPRPVLLTTLQQVADVLTENERIALRKVHAQQVTETVRRAATQWRGPNAGSILSQLNTNHDDLTIALEFLSDKQPGDALALAAQLHWFWYVHGHHKEGQEHLERLLQATSSETDKRRADAFLAAGHFANCQGNNRTAFVHYQKAGQMYRQLGDKDGIALTAMREGNAAMEEGLSVAAYRLCREASQYFRAIGDEPNLVMALFYSSMTTYGADEPEEGRQIFADTVAIARSLRDERYLSLTLYSLANGLITIDREHQRSASLLSESLHLLSRQPDILSIIYTLQSCAGLFAARKQPDAAATLLGAIAELRRIYHCPTPYLERATPLRYLPPEALLLKAPGVRRIAKAQGRDLAHSLSAVLYFAQDALGE